MGYIFFITLLVIVGLLIVLSVLIQNSKGGGLAANFASGNQTFGVRQTADFIEKFTWYLVVAMFVCCFLSSALIPDSTVVNNRRSTVKERIPSYTPGMTPVTGVPAESAESTDDASTTTPE
ncbi:MAG: preprotein translocase subunit SecG [Prevotellaceae bacterium]|jgi:preprotein translocase subunit SecG|nr:preprotein translocase subunit SecG [Prevotellaceae bacterium]